MKIRLLSLDLQAHPRLPCSSLSRRRARGFSLVEMLVVLAIIGLVMGLIGPRALNAFSDAKVKTARIQIENLAAALDLFYLDAGRYPTADEGLTALVQRPTDVNGWTGPYVKGALVPKDPWGRAYLYRVPGPSEPYEILSLGADGKEAGVTLIRSATTAH